MSVFLCILVHIMVVVSIAAMVYFVYFVIKDEPDATERLVRSAAACAGLLAYTAASAYGLSIPGMLADSLEVTKPLSVGLWGGLVPAMGGTFVAWFALRLMRNDDDVGKRGLVLFATFVFTMFADSYTKLAGNMTPQKLTFALPNVTFVLGCVVYVVFCFKRSGPKANHGDGRKNDADIDELFNGHVNGDREKVHPR